MSDHLGLAGRVRSGVPIRQALAEWHLDDGPEVEARLKLARRIRLGQPTPRAIGSADLSHGPDLAATFDLCERSGADAAGALDALDRLIDKTRHRDEESNAASAGPRLSARMIFALPLLFLPMSLK